MRYWDFSSSTNSTLMTTLMDIPWNYNFFYKLPSTSEDIEDTFELMMFYSESIQIG